MYFFKHSPLKTMLLLSDALDMHMLGFQFGQYLLYRSRYLRMDRVKSFKGCRPQILLGPFLTTLTHMAFDLKFLP